MQGLLEDVETKDGKDGIKGTGRKEKWICAAVGAWDVNLGELSERMR